MENKKLIEREVNGKLSLFYGFMCGWNDGIIFLFQFTFQETKSWLKWCGNFYRAKRNRSIGKMHRELWGFLS